MFYFHSLDCSIVGTHKRICVFGGRRLCVFGGLRVDMWGLVHQWLFFCCLTVFDDWYTVGTVLVDLWRLVHQWSFLLFWLSLDCFWRLVPYTVGAVLLDMWQLVHQFSFLLLWLSFDCFWQLVHCWYSLGRPVTIGTPMVLSVFDNWYSVPFVKNSQKTVKQQKMTIGVPIITYLHRVRRIHKVRVRRIYTAPRKRRYLARLSSHMPGQWPQPVARGQGWLYSTCLHGRPCVWLPFDAACCYTLFYVLLVPAARLV